MSNRLRILTIFLICCSTLQHIYAQDDSQTDQNINLFDLSLEELMNLKVVTSSKVSQDILEVPSTMMVITEDMIKSRGYHHLEEILHDLPGFDFSKTYGINYSTIFMRGYRSSNSDRFILLFDGINENDIWKQTTWISRQYPVSQIKQIEVLYGPASSLYGTNAFSGIINVITKKGEDVGNFNLTTTFGSWGRKNIELSTGQNLKRYNHKTEQEEDTGISYNVTAKYFSQNDLHHWGEYHTITGENSNFSQSYLNNIGNKFLYQVNNHLEDADFQQRLGGDNYAIHANVRIGDLTITGINWFKNELEAYNYNPFKRYGKYTEWFEHNQAYMLSHDKKINEKANLISKLTYRRHELSDSREISQKYYTRPLTEEDRESTPTFDTDFAHSQSIIQNDPSTYQLRPTQTENGTYVTGIVDTYRLSASDLALEEQLNINLSEKIDITTGFKFTRTNTQGNYESGHTQSEYNTADRYTRNTTALYAQAIIKPINKLNITLGGRYEDQRDKSLNGYSIFVPRASLVYKVSSSTVLRAQYSEAFQDADDWHRYATDGEVRPYGSPNLEPEKLKSFEIGANFMIQNKAWIVASAYYNTVSNFITAVQNTENNPYHGYTTGEHFENNKTGTATIYGYDIMINYPINRRFNLNANISGSWNLHDVEEEEEVLQDVLIGDIAPLKINMGLNYKYLNKLTLYPKVNFVASKKTINWMLDENTLPVDNKIQGYAIVGVYMALNNMLGYVYGLDLTLKVDNLFNATYYNSGSRSADGVKYTSKVLQPGINVMTGLTYNF